MSCQKHILLLSLTILFCSCPSPVSEKTPDIPDADDPPVVEKEDLFIDNGSSRIFSTNTYEFEAGSGATYWVEEEVSSASFYPLSVSIKKISGHSLGGFGVFFAQRDLGNTAFSALTVLINCEGEYCIGLMENQSFSYLKEWTDCSYLIQGYNQNNTLAIEGDVPGEFRISLNGSEVYQFKDSSEPVLSGGGFGYVAVVSPLENFPSIPVTIEFEKQS